jgi:hypothetical protein
MMFNMTNDELQNKIDDAKEEWLFTHEIASMHW